MKPKKNPRFDLNKKRLLFFQIGLVLVLFISWRAVEMKTYAKETSVKTVFFEEFPDELAPIKYKIEKEKPKQVVQKKETPKKTDKKARDKFEPVPNDLNQLLDSIYHPANTTKTQDDSEPNLVPIDDYVPVADIPLPLVQKSPVFPGCEDMESNADRKDCLTEKIHRFIKRNFDKDIASELNLSDQILDTRVIFMLNNKGEIVEIQARGPHPKLEEEAVRVIGMLPEITPGMHNGKAVNVLFSIPIIFEVQ
jgi:protein TonB